MSKRRNVDIFLQTPRNILQCFGIWRNQYSFLRELLMAFIMITQYSFIILEITYIAEVWGDLDEVSGASFLLFTQASVCYKSTVFILTRTNLKRLLDLMENDVFVPQTVIHDEILFVHARRVNKFCRVFLVFALTSCTLWTLMPLLDEAEIRYFPFKIWMPIDPQKSPHYEMGYLYQVGAIYLSALLFFSVDSTTQTMIIFGCAQLKIVIDKIKKVRGKPISANTKMTDRNQQKSDNNKLLVECIRQHQFVVKFIKILENTYHTYIFFQLSGSVLIICIIGLRIVIAEPSSVQFYSMFVYLVTMLSQLFLYCWCGNELTTTSEELRNWLYMSAWYEQDMPYKRSLLIALERMKRPIIFKAGKYIPLLRPTFVSVLRSSYSYFAVLNQAKNK